MATLDDYFSGLDTFAPIMTKAEQTTEQKESEKEEPAKEEHEKKEMPKRKTRKRKFEQVPSVPIGKGQPSPCEAENMLPPPKWEEGMLQQKKYAFTQHI